MTAPKEVSVNQWPANRAALRWLKETDQPVNPQQPYLIQLAVFGLEADQVTLPAPIAPSQPTAAAVSQLAYSLLVSGGWPAMQATQRLFSNPNLTPPEEMANLEASLAAASSPEEAAAAVLQVLYDLMVATSL